MYIYSSFNILVFSTYVSAVAGWQGKFMLIGQLISLDCSDTTPLILGNCPDGFPSSQLVSSSHPLMALPPSLFWSFQS